MEVVRYDYPAQFGNHPDELILDIRSMLLTGNYILSDELRLFEADFANYVGVKHILGVNSGTDAIMLALRALDLRPGDEVITQANTFYSTVAAIVFSGARPILVDADERSFLMDLRQVPAALTLRTRAIVPVHLYGKPSPMPLILGVAKTHGLEVVEDSAQAHGATIGGRRVGSFGIAGCFSFHPSKNLAAVGDGGAIATNSDKLARRIAAERNLGQWRQNEHSLLGSNSRLDAIQARVLRWKLGSLDRWNESRRQIARLYTEQLDGLPLKFQDLSGDEEHAFHLFQIRTVQRDGLLKHLRALGVDAVVRYPTPIHLQLAFRDFGWRRGQFPIAERLADELLCLPIRPNMPASEVEYVAECVHAFYKKSAA